MTTLTQIIDNNEERNKKSLTLESMINEYYGFAVHPDIPEERAKERELKAKREKDQNKKEKEKEKDEQLNKELRAKKAIVTNATKQLVTTVSDLLKNS